MNAGSEGGPGRAGRAPSSGEDKGRGAPRPATPLERHFQRIATPFAEFVQSQTTSSILLLMCTALALVLANSPWAAEYRAWVETPLGAHFGPWAFEQSLRHWINDALMSLFFFVIGLEIKREVLAGDLSDVRQARLLIVTAIGGMLAPASIYALFNLAEPHFHGWGIPMATDTAFALGVMALLGERVPRTLVMFLAGFAIVDDIGAVLVIAAFYTPNIAAGPMWYALGFLGVLVLLNALGVRASWLYIAVGAMLWVAVLQSGLHASIAGVVVAMTVPARPRLGPSRLLYHLSRLGQRLELRRQHDPDVLGDPHQHAIVQRIQESARQATTPLQRWEHLLERPVALLVLPVFALANAGVPLGWQGLGESLTRPVTLGVAAGLVVGKFVGITGMCWLGLRLRLGRLPRGLRLRDVAGVGLLGGMGFTMAIFIASLGFEQAPGALYQAKAGILVGSLIAGVTGYAWLRWVAQDAGPVQEGG